jgi:CubicO group peptidase (beta-lactamase class C family)/D-alanyl-D-alanine dipeptidase
VAQLLLLVPLITLPFGLGSQSSLGPRPDYAPVAAALQQLIAHDMAEKHIPAVSIALQDDQETVWAAGFGWARTRDSIPATAETVYRVGSVSKLFTALAVMRLVEAGRLDLDAPVTTYLPEFLPNGSPDQPITLRHLLAHHAGLVREPAIGSYFDSTGPTLAATVASLGKSRLVYPPGSRFKYSNAGLAVVGAVIERVTGEPFADYLRRDVLRVLGTRHSDFVRTPEIASLLPDAGMWTIDGRHFAAPTFSFGMAPAIGLYAPVTDLARALAGLFAAARPMDLAAAGPGGGNVHTAVLRHDLVQQMWLPQFADSTARAGIGLGCFVAPLDGHRRIWHDGAVYGFGTQLAALPDDGLGVAIAVSLDGASAVVERIAAYALRAMLAARAGLPLPPPPINDSVPAPVAWRVAGRYTAGARDIELLRRDGGLYYIPAPGRAPLKLSARGDTLIVDDPREAGTRITRLDGARLLLFGDTLQRASTARPDTAPARFGKLLGEYGWSHNTLYVYEDHGRLFALIQWFYAYPLVALSDTVFAFPQTGLYPGEIVIFRDGGRAVEAGNVLFPRRQVGPAAGGQLRLRPVRPVPELLRAALDAAPPLDSGATRAPELVDLTTLDATIHLDIRYATTNNFLGSVFYSSARAFLQQPAAAAVLRAHRRLRALGYGLLIHDAYRPWYVTKVFWDATPVASRWLVADPTRGSRHNRGSAVDLTLYDRATGRPIEMVGTYDEATPRSMPDYPGGTSLQRWHRGLLRSVMEAEGFTINSEEWWHFDYRDWRLYPILNKRFEDLGS